MTCRRWIWSPEVEREGGEVRRCVHRSPISSSARAREKKRGWVGERVRRASRSSTHAGAWAHLPPLCRRAAGSCGRRGAVVAAPSVSHLLSAPGSPASRRRPGSSPVVCVDGFKVWRKKKKSECVPFSVQAEAGEEALAGGPLDRGRAPGGAGPGATSAGIVRVALLSLSVRAQTQPLSPP